MHQQRTWLVVALAAAATIATPGVAQATSVRVRVEDTGGTLVDRVVDTPGGTINKDGQAGHDCDGSNAVGALEAATSGNWNGTWYSGIGYSVEQILGVRHAFSDPSGVSWSFDLNDVTANFGVCQQPVSDGDELLFFPTGCSSAGTCFPGSPLELTGVPATVAPGQSFQVTVDRVTTSYDSSGNASGSSSPASGVAVTGAGAPTDASGHATVTLSARGPATVRATDPAGSDVPDEEHVCVTDGADGYCGTSVPSGPPPSPTPTPPPAAPAPPPPAPPAPALGPPRSLVLGIEEGEVFAHGDGPSQLEGTVAGTSRAAGSAAQAIAKVDVRLTRDDRGRCSYYSGRSERLRRARCGAAHGAWFVAAHQATWSYLLPFRLPRGRWVLDVKAIDATGTADTQRRRGQNRVVFRVR